MGRHLYRVHPGQVSRDANVKEFFVFHPDLRAVTKGGGKRFGYLKKKGWRSFCETRGNFRGCDRTATCVHVSGVVDSVVEVMVDFAHFFLDCLFVSAELGSYLYIEFVLNLYN